MEFSAKLIAQYLQGTIVGDENATVHTFAKIEEGVPGALSFLSNPKYTPYIYETQSSIVLVNKDFTPEKEVKATMIKVDNAYEALAKLLTLYEQSKPKKQGISTLASIAESAKIGENVYIGPFAVIGENVVIGNNAQVYPHTYVGDGNPLPTFQGEPERVAVPDDIDEFTDSLWEALNHDNRISLYVRYTNLKTGSEENRLINRNK